MPSPAMDYPTGSVTRASGAPHESLDPFLWPDDSGAALVEALARCAGLHPQAAAETALPRRVEDACAALGLEAEAVELFAGRAAETLAQTAPAVLRMPGGGWLGILGARGRSLRVLAPDLRIVSVPLAVVRERLCQPVEATHAPEVDRLLAACRIEGRRRARARAALLAERTRAIPVGRVWEVRASPGASFAMQMRGAGLLSRLLLCAGAHGLEYLLWLAAWWLLGLGALSGRIDQGWLSGWALLLVTMAPLYAAVLWLQGRLAIGAGGLLKQRLLLGALRLDPDRIRREGSGQLLGRVIESENVEALAAGGGLSAITAAVELGLAALVLAAGPGAALHVSLLLAWTAGIATLGWLYYRRRRSWTTARLALTDDLVERMAGHRTRLAQQAPSHWHLEEDRALDEYLFRARAMDRVHAALAAIAPRGWLLAGLALLAPSFVATGQPLGLAVGLGGVLLAWRAARKLTGAIPQLAGAAIAWGSVKPMFDAAAVAETPTPPAPELSASRTVIDAHELTFGYRGRGEPVLRGASLRLERGDRVLLEGDSGGGKSTLASLLAGLREPHSGTLFAGGLDRRTLGDRGWRRRVAAAPQYHENHILSASLAFNLLMARSWPPTEADLREAREVCRELGLGPLLDRMPGGLQQMVGESGWQLSQGERSRVFLARALLQNTELVVLDESFDALDPETLEQSLECVLRRARTLLVVAHP